jgi:iron complex outermembrane recepter protein
MSRLTAFLGPQRPAFLAVLLSIATFVAPARADVAAFQIEAQDLAGALKAFAVQSHREIFFAPELARGRQSKGVKGKYEALKALNIILEGTGLDFSITASDAILVRDPMRKTEAPLPAKSTSLSNQGNGAESSRLAQSNTEDGQTQHALDGPQSGNGASSVISSSDNVALGEIVVTAQKRPERLQNVPISISVLRGNELDKSTFEGVSEALNTVPGVSTQQNYLGGGTVMVIRGVAPGFPTFSGSSPVAYYLDSVPFGLVRSSIAPDTGAYDLQQVEVLRGPQGTLYGASALNGVVRVITNDADLSHFDFKARVSDSETQYGGNNNRADVAVNVPIIEDKLAVRAVIGYENDDGWINQPTKANANWTELGTYRIKVNAQPTQELSIGLSAWSSRENSGAPNVGYTFDQEASRLAQPTSSNFDAYGAKVAYQFPLFTISSATSYLDYSNKGLLGLDVPFFNAPNTLFFSGDNSDVVSEEVNLSSVQQGQWRWSVGGIYRRVTDNLFQYYTGLYATVPTSVFLNTSKSYAVYGEITRLFADSRLELTAGVRHFKDDESQNDQIGAGSPFLPAASNDEANTPRGVLTWHATDHVMAYASYSQGFRSGFSQTADVLVTYPSFPPLRPDRLTNYEAGSKGSFMDGRITYDAAVYYMKWKDIQQQLIVPFENSPGIPAIVNGQSASGVGTDYSLSIEPIQDLTVTAGISWNDLEMDRAVISGGSVLFQKGDRPVSSPETTGDLAASYVFALGDGFKGRVSTSANYSSSLSYRMVSSPGSPAVVQDGDAMVFLRARFSIESPDHWTATLYGDNLNNERGSPVRAFIGVDNWDARVRPRTVGVQLDYHLR